MSQPHDASGPPDTAPPPARHNRTLPALSADLAGVILFTAIGRRNHAEGMSIAGIADTAWPFLAGTLFGWLVSRGWRRPTALMPTGMVVWVCTVAVGMALRKATGEGIALSFVAVASLVTALLILGWRAVAAGLTRRR